MFHVSCCFLVPRKYNKLFLGHLNCKLQNEETSVDAVDAIVGVANWMKIRCNGIMDVVERLIYIYIYNSILSISIRLSFENRKSPEKQYIYT